MKRVQNSGPNQSSKISEDQIHGTDFLKDSLHQYIWNQLPSHVQKLNEFSDCRIEYHVEYRLLFITPSGLGVDMDHRGNDINYFQAESHDIAYSSDEVNWIEKRKARRYDSYHTIQMFLDLWTDVVEELSSLRKGPKQLQK